MSQPCLMSVEARALHRSLPIACVSAGPATSHRCETSAIPTAECEAFEHADPIQFVFLVAFSVLRSKHPRPADARSSSRDSCF